MVNLDGLLKDPLEVFDQINKMILGNSSNPRLETTMSLIRSDIVAEPNRDSRYRLLLGYILIMRERFSGDELAFLTRMADTLSGKYN